MQYKNGFSLVEVLITLLILKVGLLGVLASQTLALKQLQNAIQRTQAVLLASSVVNDLQANPILASMLSAPLNNESMPPAAAICNEENVCSEEQLAANQIVAWLQRIGSTDSSYLIAPAICVSQSAAGAEVTISWLQRESAPNITQGCEPVSGRSWLTVNSAG